MSFLKTTCLLLVGLLISANVQARLLLITSQESTLYQDFIAGFDSRDKSSVSLVTNRVLASQVDDVSGYTIIVAAGVEAAKSLYGKDVGKARVVYTMMPLSSYEWLRDNNQLAGNSHHKVLYIDQPAHRYVVLSKLAIPGMDTLGFLHGDVSHVYMDQLQEAAASSKVKIVPKHVQPDMKLPRDLRDTFTHSDALLLMPDPYLYNRRSVQGVLLGSFRYKKPIIAYSESFVKAGALLGLFSTPKHIGMDTADLVVCLKRQCPDSELRQYYPTHFSVIVNSVVARQLGINTKSSEELQKKLEEIENITH